MARLSSICESAISISGLTARESAVLRRIADCGTERMGVNSLECDFCDYLELHYNSCRDRHCPLCQGSLREKWVRSRLSELLPVTYFHVVFTVPRELAGIASANRRHFYSVLFRAARRTLIEVASRPKNLGAAVGGLSILHTWNQKLGFHPHVHCIVPAGGVDGPNWVSSSDRFFLPIRILSRVFRGKLLSGIERLLDANVLFGDATEMRRKLHEAASKDFVVYCKPPFGGPAQVLKYLGRYTHRVGISEQRILNFDAGRVTFSYTDRKDGNLRKTITINLDEFIRRFLCHLLPRSFRKIRYFGFMANRNRSVSMACVRDLIRASLPADERLLPDAADLAAVRHHASSGEIPAWRMCPVCGKSMTLRPLPASVQFSHLLPSTHDPG